VDDIVYTPDWLASRSVRDYARASILPHHIREYLKQIDNSFFHNEYVAIKGNYNKMVQQLLPSSQVDISTREMNIPYCPAYYGIDGFLEDLIEMPEAVFCCKIDINDTKYLISEVYTIRECISTGNSDGYWCNDPGR